MVDFVTDTLLEVKNLRCERDERVLFEQLDFSVARGEVVQIEGPNGSGKTTMLRIISGLSSDYEGELLWCGKPIKKVRPDFYQQLHYLGHLPGIKAALTPRENLRWSCVLQLPDHDTQIDSALEKVGLFGFEDLPCFTLSAGQQRRVALARLYLTSSLFWILDEPFTAIDKKGVAELESMLARHAQRGGAVLLTTHHHLQIPGRLKKIQIGG